MDPSHTGRIAPPPRTVEVFYSYTHEDEAFVTELNKHLAVLRRTGVISTWHDRQIKPGTEWEQEIHARLASANVIVLLVSADFVNSDYCWTKEVSVAMQRHALGTAVVIPIVLRDTAELEMTPFGKLQMLPKDALPVVHWPRPDEVWASIARALGNICRDMQHREIVEADAAQAKLILDEIVADAQRQRAERAQIMKDLQEHVFRSAEAPRGTEPAFKRASAAFSALDSYIESGGASPSAPAPAPCPKSE